MSVHTTHLSGEQIKSAYALIESIADSDHPLASAAAEFVASVEASQFDRNPATWTEETVTDELSGLTHGTQRFVDGNGNRIPRRYVNEYLDSLLTEAPDDASELDEYGDTDD